MSTIKTNTSSTQTKTTLPKITQPYIELKPSINCGNLYYYIEQAYKNGLIQKYNHPDYTEFANLSKKNYNYMYKYLKNEKNGKFQTYKYFNIYTHKLTFTTKNTDRPIQKTYEILFIQLIKELYTKPNTERIGLIYLQNHKTPILDTEEYDIICNKLKSECEKVDDIYTYYINCIGDEFKKKFLELKNIPIIRQSKNNQLKFINSIITMFNNVNISITLNIDEKLRWFNEIIEWADKIIDYNFLNHLENIKNFKNFKEIFTSFIKLNQKLHDQVSNKKYLFNIKDPYPQLTGRYCFKIADKYYEASDEKYKTYLDVIHNNTYCDITYEKCNPKNFLFTLMFNVLKYIGYDKELYVEDAAGFPVQNIYKISYDPNFDMFDSEDFINATSLNVFYNSKFNNIKYINVFFDKNEPFYIRSSFINICTKYKSFYENNNFEIDFRYKIFDDDYYNINILLYGLLTLYKYNSNLNDIITKTLPINKKETIFNIIKILLKNDNFIGLYNFISVNMNVIYENIYYVIKHEEGDNHINYLFEYGYENYTEFREYYNYLEKIIRNNYLTDITLFNQICYYTYYLLLIVIYNEYYNLNYEKYNLICNAIYEKEKFKEILSKDEIFDENSNLIINRFNKYTFTFWYNLLSYKNSYNIIFNLINRYIYHMIVRDYIKVLNICGTNFDINYNLEFKQPIKPVIFLKDTLKKAKEVEHPISKTVLEESSSSKILGGNKSYYLKDKYKYYLNKYNIF